METLNLTLENNNLPRVTKNFSDRALPLGDSIGPDPPNHWPGVPTGAPRKAQEREQVATAGVGEGV